MPFVSSTCQPAFNATLHTPSWNDEAPFRDFCVPVLRQAIPTPTGYFSFICGKAVSDPALAAVIAYQERNKDNYLKRLGGFVLQVWLE